jgi:hypothetical protein
MKRQAQYASAWGIPRQHLVVPNVPSSHNTLTAWTELRLLSTHGKPIAKERCQLFRADGVIIETRTDANGVARFDNLPLVPKEGGSPDDTLHPGIIFPDILEEWIVPPSQPTGAFGKNKGARDDYRKCDGVVHFEAVLFQRTEIQLGSLTEEQKLQCFIHAYVDNAARYDNANPRSFSSDRNRWEWGKGSVCNQHVNFFLGYWFNYHDKFSSAGSATAMLCLPLYDSSKHTFLGGIKHRGYKDFVEPVTGYGKALDTAYDPADPATLPLPSQYNKAFRKVEYIRIAKYFESDGSPTEEGKQLIESLGPVNVYSISDIKNSGTPNQKDAAEKTIKDWLTKHQKENGLTDAQIAAKTSSQLWDIVFDLGDTDAADLELAKKLINNVTWDHHAGILLVRAPGGGPLSDQSEGKELWTFSADGGKTPGPLIEFKKFTDADLKRRFLHMAIWRLKPLAPGGFAPADTRNNAGGISVDNPPRFIRWGTP